tara:strand:- start:106 stop:390 length:285 start_codon:yes stop_codon:yes gene_type:complete
MTPEQKKAMFAKLHKGKNAGVSIGSMKSGSNQFYDVIKHKPVIVGKNVKMVSKKSKNGRTYVIAQIPCDCKDRTGCQICKGTGIRKLPKFVSDD